ncbi:MAG: hypothetical protein F6K58_12935 [Symploca sp. SIO2E9]|nr:hypothetical protein [Symploca sp. SIO2E9]
MTTLVKVEVFESLSEEEERDRLHLERKVERAFYEAGKALQALRNRRLYRSTHTTFEDYCCDRFGFQRRHPYRLIDAAAVVDNLVEMCPNWTQILPTAENQVRPLTQLGPNQQRSCWQEAVEEAGGKVPSGRLVKDIVQRIKERTKIPNPFCCGEVCQILPKDNPELRGKRGCWAIVRETHDFSCTIQLWDGEYSVKLEHLKSLELSSAQCQKVQKLCDRLTRLRQMGSADRGMEMLLSGLGKQTYLTELEEKLLRTAEEFFGIHQTFSRSQAKGQ